MGASSKGNSGSLMFPIVIKFSLFKDVFGIAKIRCSWLSPATIKKGRSEVFRVASLFYLLGGDSSQTSIGKKSA
jgi:hypothetical protein